MYINENLHNDKLTFNDLYVLICCNVFKLDNTLFKDIKYVLIKNEIISILKESSIESLICYSEIPKIIKYLESTEEINFDIEIVDFGVFYAFINVLDVLLKNNWKYNLTCRAIDDYDIMATFFKNKNEIIINEKRKQFFYTVMLYVLRPFISNLRYLQTWHKNILQCIAFNYHFKANIGYIKHITFVYNLFIFQFLDILAFEDDDKDIKLSPQMARKDRVLE
ncbi:hypothetical protein COBT_004140, partial [Conglomerata obtusa]